MAQKGVQLDQDNFSCCICLDLLKDPVTIPCGHSYCLNCIKGFWDEEDQKGIYSCPQCRQTFRPRPGLMKNMSRQEIQQRIQDREKDVKLLLQELEAINVSADKAVEDNEKIFIQLIRLIQKRRSAVKQQVRSQQETEVSRVKELQEKLEQEITELKRKDQQLEQLSNTEDHNQFLHNYPSESELRESPDSSSIKTRPLRYFQDVTAAVSELRDTVKNIVEDKWTNISVAATEVDVLLLEPISRAEFLKRSQDLTFDPNTANKELLLSPDNKKVTFLRENQSYSDHPDRFTHFCQVLSEESLTGRRYWEVEWQGGGVCVSAAYKDIKREGSSAECAFGFNDLSWALSSTTKGYKFDHGKDETVIAGPRSSRIGVYLDHRAGVLCFYSVSETMTLLHRVQTTFTQPLHAGVRFYIAKGDAAEFIQPK